MRRVLIAVTAGVMLALGAVWALRLILGTWQTAFVVAPVFVVAAGGGIWLAERWLFDRPLPAPPPALWDDYARALDYEYERLVADETRDR